MERKDIQVFLKKNKEKKRNTYIYFAEIMEFLKIIPKDIWNQIINLLDVQNQSTLRRVCFEFKKMIDENRDFRYNVENWCFFQVKLYSKVVGACFERFTKWIKFLIVTKNYFILKDIMIHIFKHATSSYVISIINDYDITIHCSIYPIIAFKTIGKYGSVEDIEWVYENIVQKLVDIDYTKTTSVSVFRGHVCSLLTGIQYSHFLSSESKCHYMCKSVMCNLCRDKFDLIFESCDYRNAILFRETCISANYNYTGVYKTGGVSKKFPYTFHGVGIDETISKINEYRYIASTIICEEFELAETLLKKKDIYTIKIITNEVILAICRIIVENDVDIKSRRMEILNFLELKGIGRFEILECLIFSQKRDIHRKKSFFFFLFRTENDFIEFWNTTPFCKKMNTILDKYYQIFPVEFLYYLVKNNIEKLIITDEFVYNIILNCVVFYCIDQDEQYYTFKLLKVLSFKLPWEHLFLHFYKAVNISLTYIYSTTCHEILCKIANNLNPNKYKNDIETYNFIIESKENKYTTHKYHDEFYQKLLKTIKIY